jgi:putative endonuclease
MRFAWRRRSCSRKHRRTASSSCSTNHSRKSRARFDHPGWRDSCSSSTRLTIERQHLGKTGEERAIAELERRGYALLAIRYRTRHGEIDIVARDGETTVFVEVKARVSERSGCAAEAVGPAKQHRLVRMARDYMARHQLLDRPCRFDVVAIDAAGTPFERITVYKDAFGEH